VIENYDDSNQRFRKDSLINPLQNNSFKYDDEHQGEIMNPNLGGGVHMGTMNPMLGGHNDMNAMGYPN
jgi:hypothetical protein